MSSGCNSVVCSLTAANHHGRSHSHEWSFCVDYWFRHHGVLLKWTILTRKKCHSNSLKWAGHLQKQQASIYRAGVEQSVCSHWRCIFFLRVVKGSYTQGSYVWLLYLITNQSGHLCIHLKNWNCTSASHLEHKTAAWCMSSGCFFQSKCVFDEISAIEHTLEKPSTPLDMLFLLKASCLHHSCTTVTCAHSWINEFDNVHYGIFHATAHV